MMGMRDEFGSILSDVVRGAYDTTERAQRRLWAARDNANRLKEQLSDAKAELAAAEREDAEARRFFGIVWGHFKDEHAARIAASRVPASGDQPAERG